MDNIILLSDTEHVLKRSARYLGDTSLTNNTRFYLENNSIIYGEIEYVPALLKLIREIIDNSIDNAIKNNFKYANKIQITVTDDTVIIEDNGTGIPVKKASTSDGTLLDILMPELAWTELKAGSNFDDDNGNSTIGQNGEGSVLVNIFSKEFIGETSDGTKYMKVHCKDNLDSKDVTIKDSKRKFTKVTFKPDLDRMGIDKISEIYKDLLEFDLMFLQETFPKINFTFIRK